MVSPILGVKYNFDFDEGLSKGRTTGSGPVNQGSNPCPSAKKVRGYESISYGCIYSHLPRNDKYFRQDYRIDLIIEKKN